jgi:exodeoxyribonuclease VII large subunit
MPEVTPIKLSDLTVLIRDTLALRFERDSFWVLADVSDHKFYPQKKYHFFDLVEKDDISGELVARVSATGWGDGTRSIETFEKETGQKFTTGIHVLVRVKVSFHSTHGIKLTLLDVDSRFTLGELEKKKQETIKRLLTECSDYIRQVGDQIMTKNKGHILNLVIQRIAVVSSKQSAGFQDFMHTLRNNGFGYMFKVDEYHAKVQGESNAKLLLEQLLAVFHSGIPYDAVVIIRGGGAETDFLIFNDFNLNRALAKFPIPVITGIGHQKDQTIADLMAHTETKTPTRAAEFIIAHNRQFEDSLLSIQKNVVIKAQQIFAQRQRVLTQINSIVVNKSRDYLANFAQEMVKINRLVTQNSRQILHARRNEMVSLSSRIVSRPRVTVASRLHELEQLVSNISTFRNQYLKNKRGYLGHFATMIHLASPEQTLKRGFALVKKGDRIITDPDEIKKGEELTIVLKHTNIISTVTGKTESNGSTNNI